MGNIRWVKRAITIEDPQRENEIELVDKNGMPVYARLQIRVTDIDWEDIPVVWE